MVQEIGVQSKVESYQRLKKMLLNASSHPYFTYSNNFQFISFEWKSTFFSFKNAFHSNSFNFSLIEQMFVYIYICVKTIHQSPT